VKAGIAIDTWKPSIFERHLTQAGYSFTNSGQLTKDCTILQVTTNNVIALQEVVKAANTEAALTGAPQ
jgi:hypothetical protein